jgi:hypothetical protein
MLMGFSAEKAALQTASGDCSNSRSEFFGSLSGGLAPLLGWALGMVFLFFSDFCPQGRTTDGRPQGRLRWCAETVSRTA